MNCDFGRNFVNRAKNWHWATLTPACRLALMLHCYIVGSSTTVSDTKEQWAHHDCRCCFTVCCSHLCMGSSTQPSWAFLQVSHVQHAFRGLLGFFSHRHIHRINHKRCCCQVSQFIRCHIYPTSKIVQTCSYSSIVQSFLSYNSNSTPGTCKVS